MAVCELSYGKHHLPLMLDDARFRCTIIHPHNPLALEDPHLAFLDAVRSPIGKSALRDLANAKKPRKVAIAIADHTRPVPDDLLLPWMLDEMELEGAAIVVLIGTGTHRDSTAEEIERKFGTALLKRVTILNHHCSDAKDLLYVGESSCGGPCWLNRHWVEADLRLATGFIEPHFYAGFSGGSKAVVPGIAGIETVRHFHRASLIDDPTTTWGKIEGNALQTLCREMVALCPPDFIVNVTLNLDQAITGVVAGDVIEAHRRGCELAAEEAIVKTGRRFPVVVTTNSGHPLDQNFYQTVKGISAASRICEEGGDILVASSCSVGLPEEGEFAAILHQQLSNTDLLEQLRSNDKTRHDQWQAQSFLQAAIKFNIHLKSELDEQKSVITRTQRCDDIGARLEEIRRNLGLECLDIAIMPRGPLTIPVVE